MWKEWTAHVQQEISAVMLSAGPAATDWAIISPRVVPTRLHPPPPPPPPDAQVFVVPFSGN